MPASPTCPACQAAVDASAKACFACGEPFDRPLPSIEPGTLFASRFEILAPLGRGGMGMVYKARDRELGETIALKILRPDVARESEQAVRRFRSEIRLARRVRHRNVCSVYGDGEHLGLAFICMELIEGVDLRRLARRRERLTEPEAYAIAIQAADGLQAIHESGIIHRDLKSSNIMRDATGVVRLMDFGIAKHLQSSDLTATAPATGTGLIVGTLEYMSPEQIRGEKVDYRSDVYSLGVVLFELFTGVLPFHGETPVQTIMKHLHEPPPLDDPALQLPGSAVPVLRRALAKDARDRFSSARELAEGLRNARDGVPTREDLQEIGAGPSTRPPDGTGEARLRGRALFLGSSIAVALFAAMVWLPSRMSGPSPRAATESPMSAPIPVASAVAQTTGALRVEGQPRGAAVILDGELRGRTPLELPSLPMGNHKVAVQLKGFEPWSGDVGIEAGTTIILALRLQAARQDAPASVDPASQAVPPRPPPTTPSLVFPRLKAEISYADPAKATTLFGWKAVSDAVAYRLMVDTTATFNRPFVDRKGVKDVMQEIRGLQEGDYYWRVAAIGHDGAEGAFSEPWQFTITKPKQTAASNPAPAPGASPLPAPTGSGATTVYSENEVDTPPLKLSGENYSPRLRPGESASVTVSWIVSESGEVAELAAVVSGGRALDEAVMQAMRNWKYAPGMKQGVRVKVRMVRKFSFRAG